MTIAPISCDLKSPDCNFFFKISTMGTKKAKVLPDPVTASTMQSLCVMKSGIVDACTGVIPVNPKWPVITDNVDSEIEGFRDCQEPASAN